jgi:adenine/guanine phosphoribosyltransferase-like PRPP-binding protein
VIARKLGTPAVLIRRVPKTYFVSYGDDPAIGDGRLAGERLPPGSPLHLIDDLVFSGQTLRSAREALKRVGLDGKTASAILWTYRADAAKEKLAKDGLHGRRCPNGGFCRSIPVRTIPWPLTSGRLRRAADR